MDFLTMSLLLFLMPYYIKVGFSENVMRAFLLFLSHLSVSTIVPVGMFSVECYDRHFWLAVQSHFIGRATRFGIGESGGVHFLSPQQAAQCGYSVMSSASGDLLLRASFLACHVKSKSGAEFRLSVHVVNEDASGNQTSYPLLLSCPLHQPWSPREIVCEETYMEVSVTRWIPPKHHPTVDWAAPPSVEEEDREEEEVGEWQLVFHRPQHPPAKPMPVREVSGFGCHVNNTGGRLLLRCPYFSRLSHMLQEHGTEVEAISAVLFYQHEQIPLMADLSVACPMSRAMVDGEHLSWTFPQVLSPLVHGWFRDRGLRIGVGTQLLSECLIRERGYEVGVREQLIEVRVPFGAEGGTIKSRVLDEGYVQSFSLDMFFIHQWEEGSWGVTQHRAFRTLNTTFVPRTPTLTNNTIPAQGMFSVTIGVFPKEVSLRSVALGDSHHVSWAEAAQEGLKVSLVPFANGSHAYLLQVPFLHAWVFQEYVGGPYRRYILEMTFAFNVLTSNELFYHHGTVACDLQDAVLPKLEGKCTNEGVLVLVHYGNLGSQWEMYLGGHRMDWEMVEYGGFVLETTEDYFSVELPLQSPGLVFENVSLQGLAVRVDVNLLDAETEKEEHTLVQRCTFPASELLVCLPGGRAIVVVNTSRTMPPIKPKRTTLLDPSCRPTETDATRALFNFSLEQCGTVRTVEGNHLVYENEVLYMKKSSSSLQPLIHQDTRFRLILQCHYLANDNRSNSVLSKQPLPQPPLAPLPPSSGRKRRTSSPWNWHPPAQCS